MRALPLKTITLKNSSGNLGMDIPAQRTIDFLTENNYVDQSIRNGFMEKVSGCVEHTEALTGCNRIPKRMETLL